MAARKHRRKRIGKVAPKASTHHLSNLKRHEAILHAIRCSNDLDWVDEVRRVAGERYNTIGENRRQKALDDKWSEVKNTWMRGTFIVRTARHHSSDRLLSGELYQVQLIRKIKKTLILKRCDTDNMIEGVEVGLPWLVNAEVIAVEQLKVPEVKARIENRIFELSMTEIGSAFE